MKARWREADLEELAASLASGASPVLTAEHATRVAHQWLLTPSPSGFPERRRASPSGEGGRIGFSTVDRVHGRIRHLRAADDVLPGGDLHQIVAAELDMTSRLLRTARWQESVGRRLLAATAELCELAGWTSADAGRNTVAVNYYLRGVSAAHAADDQVLAAHLVSSLAYQLAEAGSPADAVVLARSALARLRRAERPLSGLTPTVRALFHARLAWAHAQSGNRSEAVQALDRARCEHSRRTPGDPDPPWVYWLTEAEMEIIVGRCATAIGRPEEARHRLSHALQWCDRRHLREHTLYTSWLAEAHLRAEDSRAAARLADRVRTQNTVITSAFVRRAAARLTGLIGAGADGGIRIGTAGG